MPLFPPVNRNEHSMPDKDYFAVSGSYSTTLSATTPSAVCTYTFALPPMSSSPSTRWEIGSESNTGSTWATPSESVTVRVSSRYPVASVSSMAFSKSVSSRISFSRPCRQTIRCPSPLSRPPCRFRPSYSSSPLVYVSHVACRMNPYPHRGTDAKSVIPHVCRHTLPPKGAEPVSGIENMRRHDNCA